LVLLFLSTPLQLDVLESNKLFCRTGAHTAMYQLGKGKLYFRKSDEDIIIEAILVFACELRCLKR